MSGILTQKQSNVAKLRGMGYTPQDIAEHLDMSIEAVNATLKAIYSRKIDENRIVMAREVELDTFDKLTEAYIEPAIGLNKDAAMVILAIHDRRSKLMGLEPQKKQQQLGPQVTLNLSFGGMPSVGLGEAGAPTSNPASPIIEGELVT